MTGGAIGLDSLLSSFLSFPAEATRISKKALEGSKYQENTMAQTNQETNIHHQYLMLNIGFKPIAPPVN